MGTNKGLLVKKNMKFKTANTNKMMQEAIDNITISAWEYCVRHAEYLQAEDFCKELVRDEILEPIIINVVDPSCPKARTLNATTMTRIWIKWTCKFTLFYFCINTND